MRPSMAMCLLTVFKRIVGEMMATEKQVNYALHLMRQAGYDTDYMGSEHKKLGAKMRERQGTVRDWVAQMGKDRASELIETLSERVE